MLLFTKWTNLIRLILLALLSYFGVVSTLFNTSDALYPITLFLFILLSFKTIYNKKSIYKKQVIYGFIFIISIAWLLLSVAWTQSHYQWVNDIVLLFFLLSLVVTIVISINGEDVYNLCLGYVIIASTISLFVIYNMMYKGDSAQNSNIIYRNYLTFASPIAIGLIVSIFKVMYSKYNRFTWCLVSLYLMLSLSMSLARGALIFCVASILLVGIIQLSILLKNNNKYIVKAIKAYWLFFMPLLFLLFYAAFFVERTSQRLLRLMNPTEELAEGGRGGLWGNSLSAIYDSPLFGYGLGSSGILAGGIEGRYPHNWIFQLWLDGGVVAVILFSAFIITPFYYLIKHINNNAFDTTGLSLLAIYIFLILDFSKSYDFYTAKPIIIIGASSIAYIVWHNKKHQRKYQCHKS
ncbi:MULTISPECIES: O-antigen ligase [unclassified Cobetia]|uniref:O-antigen ligase family protein n=1 Tax=unclassified Cobetia TaxID=2609414 RepID=UPI00209813A7|nr:MULTISPECIES: O-antigen ligase family protein [unclassified Cobetia]MCO7233423.1 O-antigen ligase family protein [Cobetia sp. Dlab-2-AX]MCO7236697.1 O-antigen ligase family protein [Cobetia sp. Dlab-2-U]